MTATISASYLATPGVTSLWINAYDGTSWFSLNLSFTVTAPPLTVTTSLMFFNPGQAATHLAQQFNVTARTSGGVPPFTYSWSPSPQTNSSVFSGTASATATVLALTVTDSSGAPPTTTSVAVPAALALPDALLETAVLQHALNLSDFAAQIQAGGGNNAYILGLLQSQTGLSATQAATVQTQATDYRNSLTSLKGSYSSLTASLHKQGLNAHNAQSTLRPTYTSESALPATALANLQSALTSSAFNQLDSWAWANLAPQIEWCTTDCDTPVVFSVFSDIVPDPTTGCVTATASAILSGFDPNGDDGDSSVSLDMSVLGPAGTSGILGLDQFEVDLELDVPANQPGTYTVTAFGSATFDAPPGAAYGTSTKTTNYNGPTCSAPQITGIEIYPQGSTLPQPTSGLASPKHWHATD